MNGTEEVVLLYTSFVLSEVCGKIKEMRFKTKSTTAGMLFKYLRYEIVKI